MYRGNSISNSVPRQSKRPPQVLPIACLLNRGQRLRSQTQPGKTRGLRSAMRLMITLSYRSAYYNRFYLSASLPHSQRYEAQRS